MLRNRNGYWMHRGFFMDANDGGGAGSAGTSGEGTGADGSEGTPDGENGANNPGEGADGGDNTPDAKDAEIARLKAEMAKQKAAMDKAASEASAAKKALKAKMTQEEIDAANKQEAEEKAAKELEELRREVANGKTVKSVMGKLNMDEEMAGKLADMLYGATDTENALLLIQKAWQIKEAALRKEFGKITGPGAGGSSEEDAEEKAAIELAKRLGRERSEANKSVAEGLKGYIR